MARFEDKVAVVPGASDPASIGGVIGRRLRVEGTDEKTLRRLPTPDELRPE